ncbi:polysaccharide biosynthesis protein [Tessaracoccus sp. OS52]|uniref:polysaccharide biosynthesis protein n=1 Tax=Tessaracoccus sp. OS52 TaxID=2886691 RepID=UPI001D12113C|nr:nucleoside-diphosphate sugar epimerase/dehydratase [Tessaracoccus sp. OS52]MCC2594340.1 polysaccharide biosynthesis protein [Tessaracoccus sp. OS52]
MPAVWRRTILIAWDGFSWILAMLAFLAVRYDLRLTDPQWAWVLGYTGISVAAQVVVGLLTQLYLGRNRIGSFAEASWVGALVMIIAIPLGLLFSVISPDFPRGVAIMLPPMALIFMAAARWVFRILIAARPHSPGDDAVPALVYGAGDAGYQVAQLVDKAENAPYRIVGFLDDNPDKRRLRIEGYRVRGNGKHLVTVAREQGAQAVILAISNATPKLIKSVAEQCDAHGLELVVLPPVREMIGGQVTLGSLRHMNVADLLGRRPVETDISAIADYISGKVVLVTGAGGSIGAELASQVFKLGPAKLVLLDRDESALHGVQLELYGNGLLDTDDMVLCDIRDTDALMRVFETHRPEVVFHAAALKHLPMLERYPAEGWKTNVLGTRNVLHCAQATGVERFVNISTDKAAAASSVLGRTKRLAERLTAWYAKVHGLPYLSVRFGNVLGSRGSVLIAFRSQIEKGGPVTVTHPDVTRYFMTIPEACELVLQAGAIGRPGDVLVLDMGEPVKIVDVANRMIAESGKDIEIHFTGLRHGEKMHEVLFSTVEQGAPSEHPLISEVYVPALDPELVPEYPTSRDEVLELLDMEPTMYPQTVATQSTEWRTTSP